MYTMYMISCANGHKCVTFIKKNLIFLDLKNFLKNWHNSKKIIIIIKFNRVNKIFKIFWFSIFQKKIIESLWFENFDKKNFLIFFNQIKYL